MLKASYEVYWNAMTSILREHRNVNSKNLLRIPYSWGFWIIVTKYSVRHIKAVRKREEKVKLK